MYQPKERLCPTCECDIRGRHSNVKYCSKECRRVAWNIKNPDKIQLYNKNYKKKVSKDLEIGRTNKSCETCGNPFTPPRSNIKYCSKKCQPSYNSWYSPKKTKNCKVCNTSIPARNTYCSSCKPKKKSYYKKKGIQYFEKVCVTCDKEFTAKSKLAKYCKATCHPSHKEAKRLRKRAVRQAKLKAESWSDIAEFTKNRPEGCELDHIIPLNHPDICGLHNTWNFQWLSKNDNTEKSNKFDGTYENISWKNNSEE